MRRRHPWVSDYVIYHCPLKSARPSAALRKLRRLGDHLIISSVVDDATENGQGVGAGEGRKARRNGPIEI